MQKIQKISIFVIALMVVIFFGAFYLMVQKNFNSGSNDDLKSSSIFKSGKVSEDKNNSDSQKQCFQMLKDNMKEAETFEQPLQEMDKMTYEDLSSKFSRNYKGLSSFGIDISQGDFEMRLYSFGEQTGYLHPPITPFPSSTESEMWDEPAKQFIIAEEYVTDNDGNKRFIDCAFMSISSDNLKNVTRENYLYDGAMISLNKIPQDQSHKAWYSENVSFDHAGKPFVNWNRLFVYPKSSQNEYFDKYTVADAYPANKVDSLGVLKFFLQPMIQLQDYDEKNDATIKFLVFKEGEKEPVEVQMPKELEPIEYEGVNKIFPMSSYYQAIENQFPEFAKLLSFRGSLKYETFKKIIAEKEINPEVGEIIGALADFRPLVAYDINKKANNRDGMIVSDDKLDKLLVAVTDADKAIGEISGVIGDNENKIEKENVKDGEMEQYLKIIAVIALFIVAFILVAVLRRRYKFKR